MNGRAAPSATWTISPDGSTSTVAFRPVDPDRDAEVVGGWMREPHVAAWWDAGVDHAATLEYLSDQVASDHLTPWIVSVDDRPVAYVETYRVVDDPLASAWPFEGSELGWHVLVGPPALIGTGVARLVGRATVAGLLRNEGVAAVVCEPDRRNERMLGFCEAIGHERSGAVDLADKVAMLMVCRRSTYEERWPADLDGAPLVPAVAADAEVAP